MAQMTTDEIRWVADLMEHLNTKTTATSPWLANVAVSDVDNERVGFISFNDVNSEYVFRTEVEK